MDPWLKDESIQRLLDESRKSGNNYISSEVKDHICHALKKVADLCGAGFVRDDAIKSYTDMLLRTDMSWQDIKDMCRNVTNCGKFLPYSDMIRLAPKKQKVFKEDTAFDNEIEAENRRFELLKIKYTSENPDDIEMRNVLNSWVNEYYGLRFARNARSAGHPLSIWLKCALFDWENAGYDIDNMKKKVKDDRARQEQDKTKVLNE